MTELLEAGYPVEAATIFRRTINVQPAASYYNLGIAFKDLGRAQDSVTAYLAALEHTGAHGFSQCHYNLGRAFQMLADAGTRAGYLRRHRERRDILLRAAHHFRRATEHRSLEEVLHQLGDEPAARRSYVEFLRRTPQDGVRQRRSVTCERMRELLAQDAMRHGGSFRLPPASLCTPAAERLASRTPHLKPTFAARGHAFLPAPLHADALAYAAQYYDGMARRGESGFYRDAPSRKDRLHDSFLAKGRWAIDNDPLGLFLADRFTSLVQNVTGVAVRPGFAKAAWYTEQSKLPPHRDQVRSFHRLRSPSIAFRRLALRSLTASSRPGPKPLLGLARALRVGAARVRDVAAAADCSADG